MRPELPDEIDRMLDSGRRWGWDYLQLAADHLMANAPRSYEPRDPWWLLYYTTRDEIACIMQARDWGGRDQ